jgi:serine/threonine protein kinase
MDQKQSDALDAAFAHVPHTCGGFSRICFPKGEPNLCYKYTLTKCATKEIRALQALKACREVVLIVDRPCRMLLSTENIDMTRFAMPRMQGDLASLVLADRLTDELQNTVTKQLITGMYGMHTRQVCHLDIKLDNVLYDAVHDAKTGDICHIRVFYTDFGLSEVDVPRGTLCKGMRGSSAYMPPEMWWSGKEWCPYAADTYSFGVMIFAIYYVCFPYETSNLHDRNFMKFQNAQALGLSPTHALAAVWPNQIELVDKITNAPEWLKEIYDKTLTIQPEKRMRFAYHSK